MASPPDAPTMHPTREDRPVQPFDCGTQYAAWTERNCERCQLYNPEQYDGKCEIDLALGIAYIGYGDVSAEIAARMGYDEEQQPPYWTWDCPERVPR